MVTTKRQSCTSLLWTSEKTVFCKNTGGRAGWSKRPTFSAELLDDFPYSFILIIIIIIIIICSPSPLYQPFPNQGHCDIFRWRHQLLSTINTQIKGKLKYQDIILSFAHSFLQIYQMNVFLSMRQTFEIECNLR